MQVGLARFWGCDRPIFGRRQWKMEKYIEVGVQRRPFLDGLGFCLMDLVLILFVIYKTCFTSFPRLTCVCICLTAHKMPRLTQLIAYIVLVHKICLSSINVLKFITFQIKLNTRTGLYKYKDRSKRFRNQGTSRNNDQIKTLCWKGFTTSKSFCSDII